MNEHSSNRSLTIYDREFLLHGSKRNEVLSLAEVERYGLDSFGDADYVSIYGMRPREWYRRGVRLLGRTAVECTRDALAGRIAADVASMATSMPSSRFVVIDPFAGSCNTLFWILRHLPNSEGIAFESDSQVFEFTHRSLAVLQHSIELVHGDSVRLLKERRVEEDRGIVAFVAPPWGTALDEVTGLDLRCTTPPIIEVIEQLACRFSNHQILLAAQVHEKVNRTSLDQLRTWFGRTELRIYDIDETGRNHGLFLGTRGWGV
jgi:hypothetical protein